MVAACGENERRERRLERMSERQGDQIRDRRRRRRRASRSVPGASSPHCPGRAPKTLQVFFVLTTKNYGMRCSSHRDGSDRARARRRIRAEREKATLVQRRCHDRSPILLPIAASARLSPKIFLIVAHPPPLFRSPSVIGRNTTADPPRAVAVGHDSIS